MQNGNPNTFFGIKNRELMPDSKYKGTLDSGELNA